MNQKIEERPEVLETENECHHHWLIEGARGTTSRGVCKYCGQAKEFYNSWADVTTLKRNVGTMALQDLIGAEPEPETEDSKLSKLEKSHARV